MQAEASRAKQKRAADRRGKGANNNSGTGWWLLDFVRFTAWWSLLLWFRIKTIYPECKPYMLRGGALIVSNHATLFEPLVIVTKYLYRRVSFLMATEVAKTGPLLAWITRHVGCVEVDRNNFNMSCIFELVERMKAGQTAAIFPEGEMHHADDVAPFKSGAVLMALQAGVPVIPVHINVQESLWRRRRLVIGKPVDVTAMANGRPPTEKVIKEIANALHDEMEYLESVEGAYSKAYYRERKEQKNGQTEVF